MLNIASRLYLIASAASLLYLLNRVHQLQGEHEQLSTDLSDERSVHILKASDFDEFLGHTPRRPLWVYREGGAVPSGPFQDFNEAVQAAEVFSTQFPDATVHILASVGNCLTSVPGPQWEWSGGQYLD
ncbi:hypothetical protein [Deinococcus sp. ME38]|uniref:hypothetical protein n=1 Tax=Deinococcus sp. ME38 TaxID=3400344 RepID=UPI003B58D476